MDISSAAWAFHMAYLKKGKITMSGVYVELSSTCQLMRNKITGTQILFFFALPLEIFSAHLSVYVVI